MRLLPLLPMTARTDAERELDWHRKLPFGHALIVRYSLVVDFRLHLPLTLPIWKGVGSLSLLIDKKEKG